MLRPILATAFSLLIASPAALAADAKQMEENKKIVAAFYDAALNQKDFEKASQYLGARYTQHNPLAADGREGFNAIVDIFKLENGKVVEHWDVIQPIPEKAANDNGMF